MLDQIRPHGLVRIHAALQNSSKARTQEASIEIEHPLLLLLGHCRSHSLRAPVDLGPGVTPALFAEVLFSVESPELLAAVDPVFDLAPLVGPLPASFVDTAPLVGPLPASAFVCADAGADRARAIVEASKILLSDGIAASSRNASNSTRFDR